MMNSRQNSAALQAASWYQPLTLGHFTSLMASLTDSIWARLGLRTLNLALVLFLCWSLADLTWRLLNPPEQPGDLSVEKGPFSFGATRTDANLMDVAKLHLFGSPTPAKPGLAPPVQAQAAPSYQLKGLIGGNANQPGGAIIADDSQIERYYPQGAELPGGQRLVSIGANQVVLRRGEREEVLRLPVHLELNARAGTQAAPAGAATSAPALAELLARGQKAQSQESSQAPAQPANASLDRLRQEFLAQPEKLVELMQPVTRDGQVQGYRIQPRQLHHVLLFHGAGLRKDDIVTAINGVPLSNPADLPHLLSGQSELNFTFERDGKSASASLQPRDQGR
jgi:general secretion pathway protein C